MQINELPAVDVRGPLTAQRGRLLNLLASLSDAHWHYQQIREAYRGSNIPTPWTPEPAAATSS